MGRESTAIHVAAALIVAAMIAPMASAQESRSAVSRPERRSAFVEIDVGGTRREALVFVPHGGNATPAPLVFGFHGHGGGARQAARSFRLHDAWPAAIVVYPQGLPTPSRRVDPEGRHAGWQNYPGHVGDRDLAFFDALLERLGADHRIDRDRVFAMGHSNGAVFTYLLWARRPDVFAAFAPSAGGSWSIPSLAPKPAMHVAGKADTLVPFQGQQRTMLAVRAINGCTLPARAWAPGCTYFPSTAGAPFVSFVHDGDHKFPYEAPALIVRFFQEHPRTAAATSRATSRRNG